MNRADVIARLRAAEPALRARGVAALYLYGSYARDEAREDSDVDVLVDFEPGRGLGLSNFLAPMETLEERFPGKEIGYSTRDSIVPIYLPDIEQSAIRVF
jgi:predicted nucleotidyltransferase